MLKRTLLVAILIFQIGSFRLFADETNSETIQHANEFKVLKILLKNKRLKKVLKKSQYEYGPVQIGPGLPVIAKAIVAVKKKEIYLKNKKYIYEELQIGKRLGFYLNLGGSRFSYWKISAIYTQNQIPHKRKNHQIIESLLNPSIRQNYKRLEISHYQGSDLIAGIESPRYVLNFYNIALRSNFIKKSFFKKVFHNGDHKYMKLSFGTSDELLGRFFSELYGLDQNHIFINNNSSLTINNKYPFPKDQKFKNLGSNLVNLTKVTFYNEQPSRKNPTTAFRKELLKIKKLSLFGLISKKWIRSYLNESSKHSKDEVLSFREKSNWTNFFRKEKHSLYLGVIKKKNDCHGLVNVYLQDTNMTKNEKKYYQKNYGIILTKQDKKNITANKQVYLSNEGLKGLTKIDCLHSTERQIVKKLKKLVKKKLHDYDIENIITKIRKNLPRQSYSIFTTVNLNNKFKIKTSEGNFERNKNQLGLLEVNFISQF